MPRSLYKESDMETLNFEEWLSGVRAPVTTAHIFKRPDHIAELG